MSPKSPSRCSWLAFAASFVVALLLHLPLLDLPYFWDEAGYFVPAARDLLLLGDLIPTYTLSNAHPPLVMAYIALCWKLFGEGMIVTRVAMLLVAAGTLAAAFRLARRVAGVEVAVATLALTLLYPVFFAQSTLAHLDMAAAMFTLWGLVFYLPRTGEEADDEESGGVDGGDVRGSLSRRATCTLLLALAALAKETAILTPFVLVGWELLCRNHERLRALTSRFPRLIPARCLPPRRALIVTLLPLLAALPLALWFAYHHSRTGYFFGNPEFFRYNVESTLTPGRIALVALNRLWHVTGHMNLFALTLPVAWALATRQPSRGGGGARRDGAPAAAIFVILILAHVVALSVVGGAVLARYMLPVYPLVILLCVWTLRERVRRWRIVVAVACFCFVAGLFINPPYRFPWEENLAYRDFIILQQGAAKFIADQHPQARVLTTFPASDNLTKPHLGYSPRSVSVVPVEHFSSEQLRRAIDGGVDFDLVLLFSTNYHDDLPPEQAAELLRADIVYRDDRRGQWVAVLRRSSR